MTRFENYLERLIESALPPYSIADDSKKLQVVGSDAFNPFVIFQAVSPITQTGGNITITFDADTTSLISFDATETDIKAAVEALPLVGAGNVSLVTGTFGTPGPNNSIKVEFGGVFAEGLYPFVSSAIDASALIGPDSPYLWILNSLQDGGQAVPVHLEWK